MTDPYPPYQPPSSQPPHRLVRSRTDRLVGGVCGGVADYINMDATLVRILTVVISLFTGVPIILYLIALFVLPEEDLGRAQGYPPVAGPQSQWNYGGYPQPGESSAPQQPTYSPSPDPRSPQQPYGGSSPEDRVIWGAGGAPWEQPTPPVQGQTGPGGGAADPDAKGPGDLR